MNIQDIKKMLKLIPNGITVNYFDLIEIFSQKDKGVENGINI